MHFTKSIQIAAAAGVFLLSTAANAGPFDLYYHKYIENKEKHTLLMSQPQTIKTGLFDQLVDHAHPELGTFAQRYYIDETYADGDNAPVFYHLCGESTCTPSSLNGEIREMAKKYHAKLISLEHRYYGVSLPRKTFSTDDLKYLTTDAALRDAAEFQRYMSKTKNWNGKWISFGGSYPGSLSAYYRLKYPELVVGALASSAPVQAKENFEEYDAHVTVMAGPECAAKMREAYQEIEMYMRSGSTNEIARLKRSFGLGKLKDDQDFLYFIADIGAAAVQYGYKDELCDWLQRASPATAAYIPFAEKFYREWHIKDPISLTMQGAESENPADYDDGVGARQWFYQSCTEYGYWQNANSDRSKSTRSKLINLDYHRNVCRRLFGMTTPANTNYINNQFYQPLFSPSTKNIFFTNGSVDPWSTLSMTVGNGNATNTHLYYYTIDGAAHCDDLRQPKMTDSDALKTSRNILSALIYDWLTY